MADKKLIEETIAQLERISRCIASTGEEYDYTEVAIQALEKQIPMKPLLSEGQNTRYVKTYYCPVCNKGITGTNIAKWCYHCGQKLDWSDYE